MRLWGGTKSVVMRVGLAIATAVATLTVAAPASATVSAPYQVIRRVQAGEYLEGLAVDPSTHVVYAAGHDSLTSFNGDTGAVLHTTPVGGEQGVAVDPRNHLAYVANFLGRSLTVVDGTTGVAGEVIETGYGPSQVAIDQTSNTIYVADQAGGFGHDNGVSVVNEAGAEETSTIKIDDRAVALGLDTEHHRLYASNFSHYMLSVINTGSDTVIHTIDLGPDGFVNGVAVDPETREVWVSSGATGRVLVIDEATNKIVKRIDVGYSMWGIGINHAQGLVFVADQGQENGSGNVAIIDEDKKTVITKVPIGGTAHALAVDDSLDQVYVSNISSNQVVTLAVAPRYGPGTLSFSARTYTVTAGKPATVTVQRVGATNLASTVHYSTSPGTAKAGTDYTTTSGTVHFAAGAKTAKFKVPTARHGKLNATPTVKLTLSKATGGSLRDPHQATLTLRESAPPVLHNINPPDTMVVGRSYSYTFTATGTPQPKWSAAGGGLPAGLTLNATTGKLSGKPTTAGPVTFQVRASNGAAPAATTSPLTRTVGVPPKFTAQSPPSTGTVGTYYMYNYTATGTPAPTFSVASGALPSGVQLFTNGAFGGTPTGAGTFTFRIKASNNVAPDAISDLQTITIAAN